MWRFMTILSILFDLKSQYSPFGISGTHKKVHFFDSLEGNNECNIKRLPCNTKKVTLNKYAPYLFVIRLSQILHPALTLMLSNMPRRIKRYLRKHTNLKDANMNTQHTITPVKRLLLILIGLAGVSSLIFFKDVSSITNWLALVAIIPLIMGLTGENLINAFFHFTGSRTINTHLASDAPLGKPSYLTPPQSTNSPNKRAA
jgi:hypothetical protein